MEFLLLGIMVSAIAIPYIIKLDNEAKELDELVNARTKLINRMEGMSYEEAMKASREFERSWEGTRALRNEHAERDRRLKRERKEQKKSQPKKQKRSWLGKPSGSKGAVPCRHCGKLLRSVERKSKSLCINCERKGLV